MCKIAVLLLSTILAVSCNVIPSKEEAETISGIVMIEQTDVADISEDEKDLLALVTMAEAEGECEEGQRLVIDTILNRVDSVYFPDTISEVIYQPNQFTSMWNGRVNRCYVTDDIYRLVLEELDCRTDYDVVFFTAGGYGQYGVPMFQVGNHYFCRYE